MGHFAFYHKLWFTTITTTESECPIVANLTWLLLEEVQFSFMFPQQIIMISSGEDLHKH